MQNLTWRLVRVLFRKMELAHVNAAFVGSATRPFKNEVPFENIGRQRTGGDMWWRFTTDIPQLFFQAMLLKVIQK